MEPAGSKFTADITRNR